MQKSSKNALWGFVLTYLVKASQLGETAKFPLCNKKIIINSDSENIDYMNTSCSFPSYITKKKQIEAHLK